MVRVPSFEPLKRPAEEVGLLNVTSVIARGVTELDSTLNRTFVGE